MMQPAAIAATRNSDRDDRENQASGEGSRKKRKSRAPTPEEEVDHDNLPLPHQKYVKFFYEHKETQKTIAAIIILNFAITCIQKEIDPQLEKYEGTWYVINVLFNIVFTVELAINLYGRWWCLFWHSNWNRFDFTVVSIGIVDMAWTDMPPPLRLIRLMRAFRVFRLFSRVESMRRVIESIMKAVPGVLNAFLINVILIMIYSNLSVEFFSELYDDCNDLDFQGPSSMKTARDKCWGYDYYGSFSRAFYTMFQVLTGESWSEAAARPAITYYMEKKDAVFVIITYLFFYSFVMINSFVLLNVVVAVLMDGMNGTPTDADSDDEDEEPPDPAKKESDKESSDPPRCDEAQVGASNPDNKDSGKDPLQEILDRLRRQDKQMDDMRSDLADLRQALLPQSTHRV